MVRRIAALLVVVLLAGHLGAKPPVSESLLPNTTKGWVSVPDVAKLKAQWDKTQLGKLLADPAMKPFAKDLQRQLKDKLSKTSFRLGLTLDDVSGIAAGELSVAVTQPENNPKNHALVLLIDITGKDAKVKELLATVDTNMKKRGAVKSMETVGGKSWLVYTLAKTKKRPELVARYLVHKNLLIATDHKVVGENLAQAMDNPRKDSLAKLPGFEQIAKRTTGTEAGHVRWFVDPFGYGYAVRAAAGGKKTQGKDLLKLLLHQGFDAVQAMGGQVAFSTAKHDILHRTFVYAPPVKRQPGDTRKDKYNLAARILDFPNAPGLGPNQLVPPNVATFLTFNWKVPKAFKHVGSLVDEYLDTPGAWKDMLNSIKLDPNGPQVDVEKEIVQHLGHQATLVIDVKKPITIKSERVLAAIRTKNFSAVRKAMEKMLKDDPSAEVFKTIPDGSKTGIKVYVFKNNEDPDQIAKNLEVECLCGLDEDENKQDAAATANQAPPLFQNPAVAVGSGHLIVSTHPQFLVEVLQRALKKNPGKKLDGQQDYQRISKVLNELGGQENSFRYFTRTDEAYQTTYNLLKSGKMPQSETLLGKLLNRAMASDQEGVARQQQIDGRKLPEFAKVVKYLGPAGFSATSSNEGWLVVGCLLKRAAK